MNRCEWCGTDPLYVKYHDEEWGVPSHNDRHLFEMLILEGAQAGLNWSTILKKRNNYKKAFNNFDIKKIAKYDSKKVKELLSNAGIVRNKLKINSAIQNANAFLEIRKEFKSFDKYIWRFVDDKQIKNKFKTIKELPAKTKESDEMSKDLKKRGFNFVGSTICYAFMQAIGMTNDHIVECHKWKHLK
ncbi:MAG: DNA-3-methyladenine glycosylase I [Nanoarchaeota archaeon]